MTRFKVKWLCEKHDSPYRFKHSTSNELVRVNWCISTYGCLWYDIQQDEWTKDALNSYMGECKSFKAVLRKFRKWDLPKGATFIVGGRYEGEDIIIEIK